MKFIVDRLPYYYGVCPFENVCVDANSEDCPRRWDKYTVDYENPQKCAMLKEM